MQAHHSGTNRCQTGDVPAIFSAIFDALRRTAIRSLPFEHRAKPTVGVELFRLSSLLRRADDDALGHAIDAPQRPEFHTLYLGLRGRGEIRVDFAPVPIGAGLVTLVARGRVQQLAHQRGVEAWMLLVEPSLVGRRLAVLSPTWHTPAIELPPKLHAEMRSIVELMEAEQARPLDAQQPAVLAALLQALLALVERHAPAEPSTAPALEQFFTILERDHLTTRAVSHYARGAGLSPRRLGELLVAHTGKSTKQVIDGRVILELKRLLAFTELSVKELAAQVGFDEPTNLVKFFRHHTGTTPLAFRQAQRTVLSSARGS